MTRGEAKKRTAIRKAGVMADSWIDKAYDLAISALEQPEIIHCRDCEWWTKQQDSIQGRCARYGMYPTGEWFCGNAERREE